MFTRKITQLKKQLSKLNKIILLAYVTLITSPAFASTADSLPWDTPAQKVEDWLSGSVARIIAIVLIAVTGLMFAHGEHGSAFRRGMGVIFGISIAIGAATLYQSLGFSGAEV